MILNILKSCTDGEPFPYIHSLTTQNGFPHFLLVLNVAHLSATSHMFSLAYHYNRRPYCPTGNYERGDPMLLCSTQKNIERFTALWVLKNSCTE